MALWCHNGYILWHHVVSWVTLLYWSNEISVCCNWMYSYKVILKIKRIPIIDIATQYTYSGSFVIVSTPTSSTIKLSPLVNKKCPAILTSFVCQTLNLPYWIHYQFYFQPYHMWHMIILKIFDLIWFILFFFTKGMLFSTEHWSPRWPYINRHLTVKYY